SPASIRGAIASKLAPTKTRSDDVRAQLLWERPPVAMRPLQIARFDPGRNREQAPSHENPLR
ncbi:MAG: hypothetical protein RBS46_11655, partial [Methyloversatilis sp.]|nr:hypothetical protein [Methyloversatilis sp.]